MCRYGDGQLSCSQGKACLFNGYFFSLLANFMVERCRTDDLMPNVPISCLPSRVDHKVQGLNHVYSVAVCQLWFKVLMNEWMKVIIDCPQPGSSRATYTVGLLHSAGGLSSAAMTRWWSSSPAVLARICIRTAFVPYLYKWHLSGGVWRKDQTICRRYKYFCNWENVKRTRRRSKWANYLNR